MKKLLIASSLICAGLALNACSLTWNSFQYSGGTMADYAYFMDGEGNPYTSNPEGISLVLCLMNGSTVASVLNTGSNDGSGCVSGTYKFDYDSKVISNGDVLKVMIQDTNGGKTEYRELAAAANDAGNDPTVINTLTVAGLADDSWSTDEFVFATGNYQDVPEPTSGLMLALGLVALGLKRKQKAA